MNAKNQPFPDITPSRSSERGFTLVEIMVVVVIIGLLATMVVPNIMAASDEAKETKALVDVKMIYGEAKSYYTKNGRIPDTLEELVEPDEKGFSYLEELPLDPWDSAYELIPGDRPRLFQVISCGPDRESGTEDDISSKSKRNQ